MFLNVSKTTNHKTIYQQESIPVGCIPPVCADHTCFNSHQTSAPTGWAGGPQVNNLNRSPVLAKRCHYQWLGPGGPCTMKSHVWGRAWWGSLYSESGGESLYSKVLCPGRWGSLYGEVQCIMDNGHLGPTIPVNRMTDRHD